MESYEQGVSGEAVARDYLIRLGYKIIEKNFRSSQGEVDLIAKDKGTLVFVEVKNYSYKSFGSPVGAVGAAKKKSLIHAAETYLYKNQVRATHCRFDVITIYRKYDGQKVIEHYQDAFYVR